MPETLRIVVLSDTHGFHDTIDVPDGDILLHAGDFTLRGRLNEVADFDRFLGALPHRHKIVVAGNHDHCFQRTPELARAALGNATYLEDRSVQADGVRIFGSPWQPEFMAMSFNLPRGAPLREKWDAIPADTDIVLTHGPPLGILDETTTGEAVGCADLAAVLTERRPRLHVFGHIHEGYGLLEIGPTLFANASNCTVRYAPINPPLVIDLPIARG